MKNLIYISILLIFSFSSVFSQSDWSSVGGPTGGHINSLIEKDGYIFAAVGQNWTTGAIYRSDDNGKSWELKINNLPTDFTVQDLAFNNQYIFAAASMGGVYRSSNNGNSWERSSTGISGVAFTVHTDGNTLYAGT